MPCACNIPLANAPDNEVWGPIMWNLLHGIAEHAGKGMNQGEESQSLIQLLKLTEKIIPCPTCKEHYKNWLSYHPPDMLKKMAYENYNKWTRNFFWALHNEVNRDNKKEIFPFTSLEKNYKNINLKNNMKELDKHIKLHIQHNGLTILPWESWTNHYKKLQAIYGL
jgi:hypothetical protein